MTHLPFIFIFLALLVMISCTNRYENSNNNQLQKKSDIVFNSSNNKNLTSNFIKGKRTRKNIIDTIGKNMVHIRDDFNKYRKEKPYLKGKVNSIITIDQMGKVIDCQILIKGTSLKDEKYHKIIIERVLQFNFGPINITNDTTIIIYPFVLTS